MKNIFIILIAILLSHSIKLHSQTKKRIDIKNYTELKIEGSSTFILIPSDENKLEVELKNENVIDYLRITNNDNTLTINTTNKNKDITNTFSKLRFYVYFKDLTSITLAGTGKILAETPIIATKLFVLLKGSGNININVKCSSFEGIIKGTSYLRVKGTTTKSKLIVNGVGTINASKLKSKNTNIVVKGVGHAEVNATKSLNATINGVGSIKYSGNPKNKKFNKNGLGTIKKLD